MYPFGSGFFLLAWYFWNSSLLLLLVIWFFLLLSDIPFYRYDIIYPFTCGGQLFSVWVYYEQTCHELFTYKIFVDVFFHFCWLSVSEMADSCIYRSVEQNRDCSKTHISFIDKGTEIIHWGRDTLVNRTLQKQL